MKAKHGFAASFRSRGRLLGCSMALVLAMTALVSAAPAGAIETPPTSTYLALGDSLAFGFTQQKITENLGAISPSYFENGYDNFYGKKVMLNKEIPNKGLVIVNDGCPGELTTGLIGHNPALGGFNYTEPKTPGETGETPEEEAANKAKQKEYNPCAYHYVKQLPLHNGGYYNPKTGQPVSQLEEAFSTITSENKVTKTTPAHPLPVISLNMGGNDELAAVAACEKEVGEEYAKTGKSKYGENPEKAVAGCVAAHAPALFEKIAKNFETVLNVIDGGAKYTGKIVVNGFYNPDTFLLPGSDILTSILNKEIEAVAAKYPNAVYANPFPVFNPQPKGEENQKTKEAEEKAICKYTEMCNPVAQALHEQEAGKALPPHDGDIHPSKAGYEAIAKLMYAVAPI
jgi:lysophospholipase L1-like esterase